MKAYVVLNERKAVEFEKSMRKEIVAIKSQRFGSNMIIEIETDIFSWLRIKKEHGLKPQSRVFG